MIYFSEKGTPFCLKYVSYFAGNVNFLEYLLSGK